jgi:hypothetical protein
MEMTFHDFLRLMHGAAPAVPAAPRDKASDDAARDGISRQWRPTPGDLEPPF